MALSVVHFSDVDDPLRAILPVIALTVTLAPAFAGETPPSTEQTKAVEALVARVAASGTE
jgi:hypothetical protein